MHAYRETVNNNACLLVSWWLNKTHNFVMLCAKKEMFDVGNRSLSKFAMISSKKYCTNTPSDSCFFLCHGIFIKFSLFSIHYLGHCFGCYQIDLLLHNVLHDAFVDLWCRRLQEDL